MKHTQLFCGMDFLIFIMLVICSAASHADGLDILRNRVFLTATPNDLGSYIVFNAYSINDHSYPLTPVRVEANNETPMVVDIEEPDATKSGFTYCLLSDDATLFGRYVTGIKLCRVIIGRSAAVWRFGNFYAEPMPLLPLPRYRTNYVFYPNTGDDARVESHHVNMGMSINIVELPWQLGIVDTILLSN